MDEQTTQKQEQEQIQQPQTEEQQTALATPAPESEPEIGITSDGEVKFSDSFFGDYGRDKSDKTDGTDIERGNADVQGERTVPEQPNSEQAAQADTGAAQGELLYSPEELRSTPFEQWDRAKLPKEIADYYDAVKEQLEQRRNAEKIKNAPMPNMLGEEPKPYTAKELVKDANKLAMERLGIKDEDDFDPDYDAEHRAAVDLAKAELIQQRNTNIAMYQQRTSELNELRDFNARLVAMPDFNGFSKWYDNALVKVGKTNEQVQAELFNIAQHYGGRAVIQQLTNWYGMYRQEAAKQVQQVQQQAQQTPRPKTPPTLESTQGGSQNNRKTYNMREFGQLDDDAQTQALMDMGIV